MLHRYCNQFLDYCRPVPLNNITGLADFSHRSIQTLTARLNEFKTFLKALKIRSVKRIEYRHLIDFVADYKKPSIHVSKPRVWTLRQFHHFLTLHRHVPKNIALKLPYPKIDKTVPQFLTQDESSKADKYKLLIRHFTDRADSPMGLRNLIVIMLLGTLGLRTSTLIALNIEDVDLTFLRNIHQHINKACLTDSYLLIYGRPAYHDGLPQLRRNPGVPRFIVAL